MTQDTILEDIHRHRAEYAARFNHDFKAMGRDLQRRQRTTGWKLAKTLHEALAGAAKHLNRSGSQTVDPKPQEAA